MALARDIEIAAEVPLGPQPSRRLTGHMVKLGAFLKAQHRGSDVMLEDFQLYLESSRDHMIGEVRVKNVRFPDLESVRGWIRALSWKDCMNLLNPLRNWTEDHGGFVVKVEKEFDALKHQLVTKIN